VAQNNIAMALLTMGKLRWAALWTANKSAGRPARIHACAWHMGAALGMPDYPQRAPRGHGSAGQRLSSAWLPGFTERLRPS